MNITTRKLINEDQEAANYVEGGSTPHLRYIDEVWDLFQKETEGDLIGAFVDGKLQGMGKITRLYGAYGWLETLRVHPDYQGKGLGKAIYKSYFDEMKRLKLKSVGMYTEMYNMESKGLAEKNNFILKGEFTELLLPVVNLNSQENEYTLVSPQEAEELLSPFYGEMGSFLIINRTFYPVGVGLGAHLGNEKWVYQDKDNNVVVAGYRFQPSKALHIPFIHGDIRKNLAFLHQLGTESGSLNLSILLETNSPQIELYTAHGFVADGNYMTLWIDL